MPWKNADNIRARCGSCEAPYSQYFKCREELAGKYALDPERQWVFFPENYVWSFYDDPSLEGLVRLGATPEHVEEMTRFCQRSLEETTKWCAAAALEGGIELILRPRPATPLNDFKAAIGNILKSLPSAAAHHEEREYSRMDLGQ